MSKKKKKTKALFCRRPVIQRASPLKSPSLEELSEHDPVGAVENGEQYREEDSREAVNVDGPGSSSLRQIPLGLLVGRNHRLTGEEASVLLISIQERRE